MKFSCLTFSLITLVDPGLCYRLISPESVFVPLSLLFPLRCRCNSVLIWDLPLPRFLVYLATLATDEIICSYRDFSESLWRWRSSRRRTRNISHQRRKEWNIWAGPVVSCWTQVEWTELAEKTVKEGAEQTPKCIIETHIWLAFSWVEWNRLVLPVGEQKTVDSFLYVIHH